MRAHNSHIDPMPLDDVYQNIGDRTCGNDNLIAVPPQLQRLTCEEQKFNRLIRDPGNEK